MNILKKISGLPLYIRILIGMILGPVLGFIALHYGFGSLINDWIRPWGDLFIRLLQLIAIPLVFFSLIKGVGGLKEIGRFSRLGGKTILLYILTSSFAVILGIVLTLTIEPGKLFNRERAAELKQTYMSKVEDKQADVEKAANVRPLDFLNEIVPSNIVNSLGDNKKMLHIIFFAIVFGLAMLLVDSSKTKPLMEVIDGVNEVMLKIVDFFVALAPYGVFALMAGLIIDFSGDTSVFGALSVYVITSLTGQFLMMLVFYPILIKLFTNKGVKRFLKAMYPVQLFAFTTSSSAATLPLALETVERDLKVPNQITSFVLPVGSTINMNGTGLYQSVAVIFIAQVIGVDLSFLQLLTIIAVAVLSSIGTPSIPGGSYVILAMVLSSVGIPAEGLALILGVDRPLDMMRTVNNVTGDAVVAAIVDDGVE